MTSVGRARHAVNGTNTEIPCAGTSETSAERSRDTNATFAKRTFTTGTT